MNEIVIDVRPADRTTNISLERVYFRDDDHDGRRVMREYASGIKRWTQTNWNVLGRTRARTFVALSRPSIINQRILASGRRRIYCDARIDRTHETEINTELERYITNTLRGPHYSPSDSMRANQVVSERINVQAEFEQSITRNFANESA